MKRRINHEVMKARSSHEEEDWKMATAVLRLKAFFANSFVSSCLCGLLCSSAFAAAPLEKLAVYPGDVALTTQRSRQSFVVQATFADGITRDVTGEAKVTLSNPALVNRSQNVLTPAADGAGEMIVEFGGQTVKVPIAV